MDRISFDYSTKNIPTPPRSQYLKRLIEKTEQFIKQMRWKALFFLNQQPQGPEKETYRFNSRKSPPAVEELKEFEDRLTNLIQNIEFEDKPSRFQKKLKQDLESIRADSRLTIKADKTSNYYKGELDQYTNLLNSNITKTNKKSSQAEVTSINKEAKRIAAQMSIDDRVESIAEKEAFISMKDHKPNFMNRPTCRLICPSKSELGHVSKVILSRAVNCVMKATRVTLWKSTREVLNWYRSYGEKDQASFINFDIVEFYPSITEKLLIKAIEFAKRFTDIQDNEKNIIHTKRTVVFSNGEPWEKKDANSGFDVTMGSFDGVETCELVVCYILAQLQQSTVMP